MWAGDGADVGGEGWSEDRQLTLLRAVFTGYWINVIWDLDQTGAGQGVRPPPHVSRLHTYHIQPSHPQPGTEDLEIIKIVKK